MVFSSIIFICIFLPVMLIGYYVLPKKCKNLFLLLGSLFFYAWGEPKYIFLMLASIVGNYTFGMLIHHFAYKKAASFKKFTLIITVLFNIGLLIYFKYFMLIMTVVHDVFNSNAVIPEIALPIGISFFTFQGMSYVIDVYRHDLEVDAVGHTKILVQKNPVNLALYISMFPQLIAGPIVRYGDIKEYLTERKTDINKFCRGIERFIIGLAKKVIIANSLGEVADKIFNADYSIIGTSAAWLGAVLFTLQIYFDFSGYSDMAIGLGKMFGFEFMENFNYPYISKSMTEFWRRWHISLSTWFRDYLYIPLGGNRKGNVYVNLFVVFLATGIWHGAAWGYLAWGIWHGIFILTERVFRKRGVQIKAPTVIKWLYSMIVVTVGFAVFKIEELPKAMDYLSVMFHIKPYDYVAFSLRFYLDNKVIFTLIIAVLACIPWKEVFVCRSDIEQSGKEGIMYKTTNKLAAIPAPVTFTVKRISLAALLVLCYIFMVNSTYNPFIYFRF